MVFYCILVTSDIHPLDPNKYLSSVFFPTFEQLVASSLATKIGTTQRRITYQEVISIDIEMVGRQVGLIM
jgi:hypothetical protein